MKTSNYFKCRLSKHSNIYIQTHYTHTHTYTYIYKQDYNNSRDNHPLGGLMTLKAGLYEIIINHTPYFSFNRIVRVARMKVIQS